jgi:hypothetical protein
MMVEQDARIATLEASAVELRSELEWARQALAEADSAQSSLSMSRDEKEWEGSKLCADVGIIKWEKAQGLTDRETDLVAEEKQFWQYHVSHRRKLHDFRVELVGAVNEIGAKCLPYPKKGSTIGDILAWFTKEIEAFASAIAEVNKNFIVYCLVGVMKMLQEHAQWSHVKGLEHVLVVCDASIFNEVSKDIVKLSARIVKKWWSSYGLPYVIETIHIEPDVRLFGFVLFYSYVTAVYLWFCVVVGGLWRRWCPTCLWWRWSFLC